MALAIENASIGTALNAGTSSTTGTITTNVTVASGATVQLAIYGHQAISSVTDNSGNGYTWAIDKTQANGASLTIGIATVYASAGLASGTVITITWSSASNTRIAFGLSYTGGPSGTRLDATPTSASFFGPGGTPPVPWASSSLTPATSPSIVFGLFGGNGDGAQSSTPDAGWTEIFDLVQGNDHFTGVYQIVANTTARNPSGTLSVSPGADQAGITANYKEAAGGGGGPATIPGAILQGFPKTNGVVQAAPVPAFAPKDPTAFTVTFLFTAPPIYSSIVAGSGNQGYRMVPAPQYPRVSTEKETRRGPLVLPSNGTYYVALPPVYYAIVAGRGNQGSTMAPAPQYPSVSADREVRRSNTVLPSNGSYAAAIGGNVFGAATALLMLLRRNDDHPFDSRRH